MCKSGFFGLQPENTDQVQLFHRKYSKAVAFVGQFSISTVHNGVLRIDRKLNALIMQIANDGISNCRNKHFPSIFDTILW